MEILFYIGPKVPQNTIVLASVPGLPLKAIIHEATLLLATCCLVYDAKLPSILSLATSCSD